MAFAVLDLFFLSLPAFAAVSFQVFMYSLDFKPWPPKERPYWSETDFLFFLQHQAIVGLPLGAFIALSVDLKETGGNKGRSSLQWKLLER